MLFLRRVPWVRGVFIKQVGHRKDFHAQLKISLPLFREFGSVLPMSDKKPSPFQASFLLTGQEQRYILIICTIALVGIAARYFYLKNETATVYTPAGIDEMENGHE